MLVKSFERKSDVPEAMLEFIRDLEAKHKIKVKKLRCDRAGENIKTDELLRSNGLGIEFKYTAAGTPQQNGKVERKIATIIGKLRSMLSAAGIKDKSRHRIWGEEFQKQHVWKASSQAETGRVPVRCFLEGYQSL